MSKPKAESLMQLQSMLGMLFRELTEGQVQSLIKAVETTLNACCEIPGLPESGINLEEKGMLAEFGARGLRVALAYNGSMIAMAKAGIKPEEEEANLCVKYIEELEDKLNEIGLKHLGNLTKIMVMHIDDLPEELQAELRAKVEEKLAEAKDLASRSHAGVTKH